MAAPKVPQEAPRGLEVTDRRVDPTQEALQRAAMIDHQRRQQPGQWTNLPNGQAVKIQPGAMFKYPGQKKDKMYGMPGLMLLDRKPDYNATMPRYQWRCRTSPYAHDMRPAETAQLHRAGRIRYIETKEIDPNCPFAVFTPFGTPNNEYVTDGTMILCEILDPSLSYESYKGWDDYAIQKSTHLAQVVESESDTHYGDKAGIQVKGPMDAKQGG